MSNVYQRNEEAIEYLKDCLDFCERHFGTVVNTIIHLDEDDRIERSCKNG